MSDIFVGGSETSTNAMSEGVLLLCRNPDQYALLESDVDAHIQGLIEESLRLQSPVQGLYRVTTCDVEIQNVRIPAGSLLNLRFAAANRDETQFPCPSEFDVQRDNAGSHMAFGSGIHHCIGAPLARLELYWGFKALLQGCRNIRLAPGRNDFTHAPGLMLRSLESLHIEFDAVS
jgi:cytochrome P450